ncbi:X-ray repair cross-complementing protein 5-like [Watersipora subatra]|uniref:X-ray repair cross-complementing protein 5-like n=1 Tax=Watersipora subatra TaxID=2589382 RepID=UPI00355B1FB7
MNIADWDWTGHVSEEDDQNDDGNKPFASQQSGIVFVIDCSPSMFVKSEDDEENHFTKCVRCIQQVCQKKVLSNDKDLQAVVMFGVGQMSSGDNKAIHIYQTLGQLNIQRITDLESVKEDTVKFESDYGHSDNFDMSDVLWTCSNVFANCNKTLGEKKVLLFTNNDDPHKGNASLQRKAIAKATDLKAMGIELELLALRSKSEGKIFNMESFYKDVLSVSGQYDARSYAEPSDKFEALLIRVHKKEHKRRALGRIPFKLNNSIEMSVGIYSLCRRTALPPSVKIHSATNSEVRTQTRVFNATSGEDVMPQDILSYQEYAGKRICLEPHEVTTLKSFDMQGLKLIGFKNRSDAKLYQHVKPSHFLYPDETSVKGSTGLFTAMLSRCAARDMVAVCWYVPRSNSTIELVHLLPQLEERDSQNVQITPPGFHVIFCPFKEDVREISTGDDMPSATPDQVEKCAAVIKKLSFPYNPSMFDNPALQKFYSNLEAMALSKDEPDDITDYSTPVVKKMEKKASAEMEDFMSSIFPDGVASTTAPKRSAGGSAGASKRPKVEAADHDVKSLATSGELKRLTVADLKNILKKERIRTSATKKQDLIAAISSHFGV